MSGRQACCETVQYFLRAPKKKIITHNFSCICLLFCQSTEAIDWYQSSRDWWTVLPWALDWRLSMRIGGAHIVYALNVSHAEASLTQIRKDYWSRH